MRIVSRKRLVDFWATEEQAQKPLRHWYRVTNAACWQTFAEVRQTFRHADQVRVGSGSVVTVFNIGGNNYRLIAAIHYNRQTVYILRVLSHGEYDRMRWKEAL